MKRRRNKKRKPIASKYLLLGLSIVCLIAIFAGLLFNINGGPLNSLAGHIFIPMQQGINHTGEWLSDKTEEYNTIQSVLEENEALKEQIESLMAELDATRLDAEELEQYRELYELDRKYPSFEKVAASVVAKSGSNWFSIFTINRGKNHGIDIGMNVIADGGLVGIVIDVGPNYAKVKSIIDDTSNVSSMVSSTGDNFNVSGSLESMNKYSVINFSELRDSSDMVKVGDQVVTSYISDKYLQGILIGYISEISDSPNNLTKHGTITPVVDFQHLEHVFVITRLKETGDPVE